MLLPLLLVLVLAPASLAHIMPDYSWPPVGDGTMRASVSSILSPSVVYLLLVWVAGLGAWTGGSLAWLCLTMAGKEPQTDRSQPERLAEITVMTAIYAIMMMSDSREFRSFSFLDFAVGWLLSFALLALVHRFFASKAFERLAEIWP